MIICGQEVPGITYELVHHYQYGRHAVRFNDTRSGFFNFFALVDGNYPIEDDTIMNTLAINFIYQSQAYRLSMKMAGQATAAEKGPLDEVVK